MSVKVTAIMTRKVIVASEENSLLQVLEFFTQYKIQHLPVCRNENELVGIISVNDVLNFTYKLMKEGKAVNENVLKLSFSAADIMTANPISLSSESTIDEALEVLSGVKFQALPICDEGKIVGIVTNKDLVKHLSV